MPHDLRYVGILMKDFDAGGKSVAQQAVIHTVYVLHRGHNVSQSIEGTTFYNQ